MEKLKQWLIHCIQSWIHSWNLKGWNFCNYGYYATSYGGWFDIHSTDDWAMFVKSASLMPSYLNDS